MVELPREHSGFRPQCLKKRILYSLASECRTSCRHNDGKHLTLDWSQVSRRLRHDASGFIFSEVIRRQHRDSHYLTFLCKAGDYPVDLLRIMAMSYEVCREQLCFHAQLFAGSGLNHIIRAGLLRQYDSLKFKPVKIVFEPFAKFPFRVVNRFVSFSRPGWQCSARWRFLWSIAAPWLDLLRWRRKVISQSPYFRDELSDIIFDGIVKRRFDVKPVVSRLNRMLSAPLGCPFVENSITILFAEPVEPTSPSHQDTRPFLGGSCVSFDPSERIV